jgi:hypothetical protein
LIILITYHTLRSPLFGHAIIREGFAPHIALTALAAICCEIATFEGGETGAFKGGVDLMLTQIADLSDAAQVLEGKETQQSGG